MLSNDKSGTTATFESGSTVTVIATPDDVYVFSSCYVDGCEPPVSTDAEIRIVSGTKNDNDLEKTRKLKKT